MSSTETKEIVHHADFIESPPRRVAVRSYCQQLEASTWVIRQGSITSLANGRHLRPAVHPEKVRRRAAGQARRVK